MSLVETTRLRLRPVAASDVDTLHAMWTDPDVRRYLWDGAIIDRQTAAAVIEQSTNDWRERRYGLWLIEDRETNDVAGFVGFRSPAERSEPELLYGLLPRFWHRGLATEASSAALRYLFETLGHDAVCAATDPPNEASIRVLERLGMTLEREATAIRATLSRF